MSRLVRLIILNEHLVIGAVVVTCDEPFQSAPGGDFTASAMQRCASFDGDADRLIYYYTHDNGSFQLLVSLLSVCATVCGSYQLALFNRMATASPFCLPIFSKLWSSTPVCI
jgi:hypothetical protein